MRRYAHRWVRAWWEGRGRLVGTVLDVVTAPVELLYSLAVGRRNRRYDLAGGTRVDGIRVVSVGNLTVGGTGKTPLSAWLVGVLVDAGRRPALVSRGYGRDELLLHAHWHPGVPVFADPDRVAAVRAAAAAGADVAVLDDGFQHRRLARDVDVVLLAAEDVLPGRLLPRGPYREPVGSLARAHAVVITRRTAAPERARDLSARIQAAHPDLVVAAVTLDSDGWADLSGAGATPPVGPTLVATSVARPDTVARQVEDEIGAPVGLLAFPDHHPFDEADARRIRAAAGTRSIAVTEKDAVKLAPMAPILGEVRVLKQRVAWDAGEDRIRRLVFPAGAVA